MRKCSHIDGCLQDQSLGKATKVLCQATLGEALGANPERPKLGDEGLADGAPPYIAYKLPMRTHNNRGLLFFPARQSVRKRKRERERGRERQREREAEAYLAAVPAN
eukprot:COSAG03_NODE_2398_length_2811_cov_50.033186_3_plen_107_part_00